MIYLHKSERVNFCLLMALAIWVLLFWPVMLLLFATFLHTPEGVIVSLAGYIGAVVGPVVVKLMAIGKKKEGEQVDP